MKSNSGIFSFMLMLTIMAMGIPQDIKMLSYKAYLDQDKNTWKSNVALATKAYQSKPSEENLFQLSVTEYGLLNATMRDQDESLFDGYVDGLVERLEQLTESKTFKAEAKALLSSVYGYKIAYSPMKGMILGLKTGPLLDEAMSLKPNSAIVLKMYAGNKYFTPEMWGGDKVEAEKAFEKSNAAFEKEGIEGNWMYLDNLAWIGQIQKENGKVELAKATWEKALTIEPNFFWVSRNLLPSLK
jgi:tetratricopeptide (TPR) repeat protein